MMRMVIAIAMSALTMRVFALSPVAVDKFLSSIDQSSEIKLATWSGRGDLCMQKAKETGYLMLWVLYENNSMQPKIVLSSIRKFLENDLCRQKFCDLINNYQYIILCCENYNNTAVFNRKNAIYGYPEPKKILNESTGEYEKNHNGYPVYTGGSGDNKTYCDHAPSIHLLKFDSSANVIFHICAGISAKMTYDTAFSPYASRFPIPNAMCTGSGASDKFAPWLKLYLDMYPVSKQIETYESSGGDSQTPAATTTVSEMGTNYIYEVVEIAVTETLNPTVYQIALHRDNLLFRSVTTMHDLLVKRRIEDNFTQFDDGFMARNGLGRWFVNHDDTLSAMSSEISSGTKLDIIPTKNCTLEVNQRVGNGFTLDEYAASAVTNIYESAARSEIGTQIPIVVTNIEVTYSSTSSVSLKVDRNVPVSHQMSTGKMLTISSDGNATYDIMSSK